jgi:hypothetical protein
MPALSVVEAPALSVVEGPSLSLVEGPALSVVEGPAGERGFADASAPAAGAWAVRRHAGSVRGTFVRSRTDQFSMSSIPAGHNVNTQRSSESGVDDASHSVQMDENPCGRPRVWSCPRFVTRGHYSLTLTPALSILFFA